jgi:hypothetical protein
MGERGVAETASGVHIGSGGFAHAIGSLVGAASTGLLGEQFGHPIAVLSGLVGAVGGFGCSLLYHRYVAILGAGGRPKSSRERQTYERLRTNLTEGNLATRLYIRWLSATLSAVARFFGDAEKAKETLFPHAFGLRGPAVPLWTATAFDRCMLIALIYPVVTIFLFWIASGHVGPAEAALGMDPRTEPWRRDIAGVGIGGGLSRCPREPHMMYSGVAASHLRRARGGAQWQGHDL